jgi:hypothetical protein
MSSQLKLAQCQRSFIPISYNDINSYLDCKIKDLFKLVASNKQTKSSRTDEYLSRQKLSINNQVLNAK